MRDRQLAELQTALISGVIDEATYDRQKADLLPPPSGGPTIPSPTPQPPPSPGEAVPSVPSVPTSTAEGTDPYGLGAIKSVFGNVFSLLTKWKCPHCGERAGCKIGEEQVGDAHQVVQTCYDGRTNTRRQMVVNRWSVRLYFQCESCSHQWAEVEGRSDIA